MCQHHRGSASIQASVGVGVEPALPQKGERMWKGDSEWQSERFAADYVCQDKSGHTVEI